MDDGLNLTGEEPPDLNVDDALAALDADQLRRGDERLQRIERGRTARGSWRQMRAHPAMEQPSEAELGDLRSQLRARCGVCGRPAVGRFARYDRGTVWESVGDRWRLTAGVVRFGSFFLCPFDGQLAYRLDDLASDLDDAESRANQTSWRRLAPGSVIRPAGVLFEASRS